jgi:hypothetical protein
MWPVGIEGGRVGEELTQKASLTVSLGDSAVMIVGCRSCKWWLKNGPYAKRQGRGECTLTYDKDDSLAKALDEDDGETWLETAPEFGCVQWEEKE